MASTKANAGSIIQVVSGTPTITGGSSSTKWAKMVSVVTFPQASIPVQVKARSWIYPNRSQLIELITFSLKEIVGRPPHTNGLDTDSAVNSSKYAGMPPSLQEYSRTVPSGNPLSSFGSSMVSTGPSSSTRV